MLLLPLEGVVHLPPIKYAGIVDDNREGLMFGLGRTRWLLTTISIVLLTGVFCVASPRDGDKGRCDSRRDVKCRQVPEGGTTGAYLLAAGLTCVATMFMHSRRRKERAS